MDRPFSEGPQEAIYGLPEMVMVFHRFYKNMDGSSPS